MSFLKEAQIELVSHKLFSGIKDKNGTVKPMELGEAREALEAMGYKKIRETTENGATIETWELPTEYQIR